MATKYPPYVNAYGKLSELFGEIRKASVPPKFTQDFMATKLGLKSSSFRAMIPLLKKLGFLDTASVPTKAYKDYRGNETHAKAIMGQRVKAAYSSLYEAAEYAHGLNQQELADKLKTLTGAADDDKNLPAVVGTFSELCKLSVFDVTPEEVDEAHEEQEDTGDQGGGAGGRAGIPQGTKLGISYTINLNLPATTEIEVFNSIFKSLKEHILSHD